MAAGFSEIGVIDPLIPSFLELRAVAWQNGKAIELGTFGGNDSMAQAINSRGRVVGFALNSTPDSIAPLPWPTEMRAFLWDNGAMQNLGTLGGPDSWAFFVNDSGQVAGISYPDSSSISGCDTPGKNRVFLWEKGHMQDIGTLGGSCSWPEGLCNQGGSWVGRTWRETRRSIRFFGWNDPSRSRHSRRFVRTCNLDK